MILVTGATGNIGSELLQQLSTTGAPVRAFVRDMRQARSFLRSGSHLRPYLRSIVETAGVELNWWKGIFPGQKHLCKPWRVSSGCSC